LTIADLKKGQKAVILDTLSDDLPVKLYELGCLPGNKVELIKLAPFKDPIYLNINGSFIAIRRETARLISVELE
jgi:ferrous iron transport protein A